MARIEKEYEVCYAHRLLNHKGKCARLHGHNARIRISIEGPVIKDESRPDNGMVMDFGDLDDGIGKWLNSTLDHHTILEVGDPVINALVECGDSDSLVVIDMPPTAELLGGWIHAKVMDEYGVYLDLVEGNVEVTFWETTKACAVIDDSSNYFNIPVQSMGGFEFVSSE